MIRLEEAVIKEKPDILIVYEDTNATVVGALVGANPKSLLLMSNRFKTGTKDMSEEINRVVTDHVSKFYSVQQKELLRI
ncbi:MAG: UDP-N-acetylglucosamine 2-epimerase [Candidatus Hodarchaeales archaeon]